MTFTEQLRETAIGSRAAQITVSFLVFACLTAQVAYSRSRITEVESGEEGDVKWVRLENEEIRIDFSLKNHDIPEDVVLLSSERNLAGFVGDEAYFWKDLVNGEPIADASSTVKTTQSREGNLDSLIVNGYCGAESGSGLVLTKEIHLIPDGAQLEVRFRLTNTDEVASPATYALATPWAPGGRGESVRFHVPKTPEILRFEADAHNTPVVVEGVEMRDPWFCADSPKDGLAIFFISSLPIVRWSADSPVGRQRRVETVLWDGLLKPGESVEGFYWIAVVENIGLPVAAGSQYAVGAEWQPMPSGSSYRLETRVTGMPGALKKFRFFSAIRDSESTLALVPKYTRRSRLSPTEIVRVPLPGCFAEGTYVLEQSIYASSRNVGYWKTSLRTPGTIAHAAVGSLKRNPGLSSGSCPIEAASPRSLPSPPLADPAFVDATGGFHDLETDWTWPEDHEFADPAFSEWSDLLALEEQIVDWVFVDEEK
jgi:hypothetical protein